MVSEWRQHRDEAAASVCQRKDTELVQDVLSVGDGGEQPVEVVLGMTSREESKDCEEVTGIRAEFLEHWGGQTVQWWQQAYNVPTS